MFGATRYRCQFSVQGKMIEKVEEKEEEEEQFNKVGEIEVEEEWQLSGKRRGG